MKNPLSSTWKKTKLGELFRIKHGYAFKGEFFSDTGPYILLTPGNFKEDGGIKLKGEKEKYYTGDFPSEYLLKRGDFLIVLTDLMQEAPILGSPAFIMEDNRFLHNQRLGKIIELNEINIEQLFLYYLFNSFPVRSQIKATATGATVKHTAPERIYAIEVQLPPFCIQQKIAAILSAYDDLIENNTRRIALLEEMAQSLYREWFVHFRFPGHEKNRMVESALGMIPEGWEVKAIGEVIETLGGGTPSTHNVGYWDNGDVIWYSPTDLTSEGTMFIADSAKKITELGFYKSSARMFPAYSVMMTSRATIGVIAINTRAACTNQGFITCIPNKTLSAQQIYFWLAENKEKIISLASGATFKEINRGTFRKLPVAIPDKNISQQFNKLVLPFCKQVENLIAKNANLRQTRDLLLPKLISGEVDVEGLEIAGVGKEGEEGIQQGIAGN